MKDIVLGDIKLYNCPIMETNDRLTAAKIKLLRGETVVELPQQGKAGFLVTNDPTFTGRDLKKWRGLRGMF